MNAVAAELHRLASAANTHAWDYERTQAIAAALAQAGATGHPLDGCGCPIATHLHAATGQTVYVTHQVIVLSGHWGDLSAGAITLNGDLQPIGEFVRAFDNQPDRFAALRAT